MHHGAMSNETSALKRARIEQGLTMEAVAARAGVSLSTLRRAELGTHDTNPENWQKLARALGRDVQDIRRRPRLGKA